jgi:hypothetical protein
MASLRERLQRPIENVVNRIVLFIFPDAITIPVDRTPPPLTSDMSPEDAVLRSFLTGKTIVHGIDEAGNPTTSETV